MNVKNSFKKLFEMFYSYLNVGETRNLTYTPSFTPQFLKWYPTDYLKKKSLAPLTKQTPKKKPTTTLSECAQGKDQKNYKKSKIRVGWKYNPDIRVKSFWKPLRKKRKKKTKTENIN